MTHSTEILSAEAFAMLTLETQIEHLSAQLSHERAENLVQLCAEVRDPAPLAWLCRRLVERNWLQDAPNRAWLASFLIKQAETTVHKVLRGITESSLADNHRKVLAAVMIEMLKAAHIKELSSICLVDRALRHHFSEEHDDYLEQLLAQSTTSLRAGAADKITLAQLAQLPAKDIAALYAAAAESGPATTKALDALRNHLSVEAIEVLGDAPKAVSQANAEDLLARRVYTDPGHFLIELLQNAEDSGARHWRVHFDSTRIVVWHDGAPFDARDVVGVTSIGQTTKRKQQIGFFGVGFKSVYEVTDRPQIYSDVWKFEIADVSIPKVLAHRPDLVPADGTVLVLPLRANLDDERSPKSLYEKATQLDACVLLTLRSIDVIELELTAAAGGPARHALIEGVRQERSSIRHEPSGTTRTYWIRDDRYEYDEKTREAGRPDESMVMVGALFDEEHHKPVQLEDSAATVYSYLPTREKTGLRFFVQGHFDVPLDRERIAPDSLWNKWILSQVPHQLAHMAEKLSADQDLKCAEGFLDVLPLRSEVAPSLFQIIVDGLKPALQSIAFVPASDGSLRAPEQILVAPSPIAALFQEHAVSEDRFLSNPSLNARAQELVLTVGAAPFDTPHLLTYLEGLVPTFIDGKPPAAPAFLNDLKLLENLYAILLAEADRLEQEGAQAELAVWLARLKKLPIVMDTDGRLAPPQRLARGGASFRAIYGGIFKFIDERLETASASTMAFLNRTGVLTIEAEYLVQHLERVLAPMSLPLMALKDVVFPGNQERLSLILQVLADAGWEQQKRVCRLPLFGSMDGAFWPAAANSFDQKGVLRVRGHLGSALADFYGKRRPLTDVNDLTNASSLLLDRVACPLLDLSTLCDDLGAKLFGKDLQTLRQLHALLESVEEEISDKTGKQLCELVIWPDRRGDARPLKGAYSVLLPENEELCLIFSQAPFLDQEICTRKHLKRLNVEVIGANHIVSGLTEDAKAPMLVLGTAQGVERALAYLLRYSSSLDSKSRTELRSVKAFLSDRSEVLHLYELSIAVCPELRALYGAWSERHFVSPDGITLKLIRALSLEGALATADAAALIADLEKPQRNALIPTRESLRQVLSYLAGEAESIPGSALARLVRLPIFPDQKGTCGILPMRTAPAAANMVRPCEPSVRPLLSQAGVRLLDADIESDIKPILDQVHAPYAGLEELIQYLTTGPVLPDAVLEPLQKMLVERKAELIKLYPLSNEPGRPSVSPILNSLAIWKAHTGDLLQAGEVVAPGVGEIIGDNTAESAVLNQRTIDDQAFQRLRALAPLVASTSCEQFICQLMRRVAQDKKSLSVQPRFLSSVERINDINRLIADQPDATPVYVDALNQLSLEPLYYADATTYALLDHLPVLAELLHPDFQRVVLQKAKVVQEPGFSKHVRAITGFFRKFTVDGSLETAASPSGSVVDCEPFPPNRVVAALGPKLEEKRRPTFYSWLATNEENIYADSEALKLLAAAPFFRTRSGAMVCARDLVIETDLPDIGLDWFPSPEIPESVLSALQKHLNVGHPKLNDLIKRNVVPAYIEAYETVDNEKAARLVQWLAQRLSDRSPAQIKDLVLPKDPDVKLKFEDARGNFKSMDELIIPAPRISEFLQAIWGADLPTPSPSRYSPFVISFLADLGIPNTPSLPSIRIKLGNPQGKGVCAGLAGLACYLRNQNGELVYAQLPLRTAAWLQDAAGAFRVASDLFIRTADIECVVGTFPELYLADGLYEVLGETVARELKFRDINSITFEDVARHIMKRTESRTQPPFAVYTWLDQQVQKGRIDGAGLNRLFGAKPWIWSDDGEVFPHAQVLGLRAFHLFKSRRGYWERGFKECRALCHALGIAGAATPNVVASFVEELGKEVKIKGGRKVLAEEPALPHMLLSAFNILGLANRSVERNLPIIPCFDTKNETDLLPPEAKNLFWSDTPTLDVLFAKAGPLCLAMRGRLEEREGVETFHELMGVHRLRDAYRLEADAQSGIDRSEQKMTQISELRSTLRALLSVLPRIELERPLTEPSSWVYSKRLRSLADNGTVRAVDNLGVRYVLPGVGETRVQQMATYNEDDGALVVDTRVLNDSERTGLAEGLIAAIVEGPMADSFIDLVEILLARVTRERMNEYLNRRHFADAAAPAASSEMIAERITEIFDYGLDLKLKRSFPQLKDCALERWRDAALISKMEKVCLGCDIKKAAHEVVPLLLDTLDLKDAPDGLTKSLEKLLSAPTLSDASSVLVDSDKHQFVVTAESASGQANALLAHDPDHIHDGSKPVIHGADGEKSLSSFSQDSLAKLRKMLPAKSAILIAVAVGVFSTVGIVLWLLSVAGTGGGIAGAPVDLHFLIGFVILLGLLSLIPIAIFVTNRLEGAFNTVGNSIGTFVRDTECKITQWWHSGEQAESIHSILDKLTPPPSNKSIDQHKQPNALDFKRGTFDSRQIKILPAESNNKPSNGGANRSGTARDAKPAKPEFASPPRITETAPLPQWTDGNGFRPHDNIPSQLWATRANRKTLTSQGPSTQLCFSPSHLPPPYLYAVHQLGISFNQAEQTWKPDERVKSHLNTPGTPSGRYVQFLGLMEPGKNQLPLPLYGRIVGDVETADGVAQAFEQDAVTASCIIRGSQKGKLRYRVQLLQTPKLEGKVASELSLEPLLLQPTVSIEELPPEVQEWLDKTRKKGASLVRRALAAQAFIRRNYAYDDAFLERQDVRRARARLPRGKGNHHLTLLHASGEGTILGRGICYELNVLLVELLRRLEVPAMTATGWVLKAGIVDVPDHLFALAVVPSEQGACLLTLDAAATDQGPITPMGRRTPIVESEQLKSEPLPSVPAPMGAWNNTPAPRSARNMPGAAGTSSRSSSANDESGSRSSAADDYDSEVSAEDDQIIQKDRVRATKRHVQAEIALLRDAIHRVCTVTGANHPRKIADDLPVLAGELSRLLGDKVVAETYLLILRGDLYRLDTLSPQVQKLVNLGLVHVEPLSAYKIAPVNPDD